MTRLLLVEDEKHLAEGLRFNLEAEGYSVDLAETGEEALELLKPNPAPYDVLILDVMLPDRDGFTVMSELRAARQLLPTLMLTARGHPGDVLRGFETGADDYLTKPFELAILIARIRGLLRRRDWLRASLEAGESGTPTTSADSTFVFGENGSKSLDCDLLELRVREKVFQLTLMEAHVLRYLFEHEGKAVSRKAMLEAVWGVHESTDTRPIDNFIVRLRRYIEDDPTNPQHVLTVRGVGYRFIADPSRGRNR
jgi:DNA-binding response OmpR family regulator